MKNKMVMPGTIFGILAIFAVVILFNDRTVGSQPVEQPAQVQDESIVMFYGIGCPHCEIVEEYIEQNNVKDKVTFSQKEVYYNQQNATDLAVKARACGIPTNSIGVPFLWDGSNCLIGDKDIIDFFKTKSNLQ